MQIQWNKSLRRLLIAALILWPPSGPVLAWSTKEHILLTRIAAEELLADASTPPAMKQWLRRGTPGILDRKGERDYFLRQRVGSLPRGADGLPFWATVPDMNALMDRTDEPRKIEPFGVPERLLHFIDLEYFNSDEARRTYADDLSHKPALSDFPRDIHDWRYSRGGMLPFRVEQCFGKLVEMIRGGKLNDTPGQFPRDETAEYWAGFLAHYAQDNTQPQHATIDYRSASYFRNPRRAPNVHGDVEFRLVDDELNDYPKLREEFWNIFEKQLQELHDPAQSDDPWRATLEVSLASYDALPLIGRAARAAYRAAADGAPGAFDADAFFHFRGVVDGRQTTVIEMKARQMAWAVKRVERLWRKAWGDGAPTSVIR